MIPGNSVHCARLLFGLAHPRLNDMLSIVMEFNLPALIMMLGSRRLECFRITLFSEIENEL